MDTDSCLALIALVILGTGIDMLVAWGIAAIWSLPFWPVFLTVLLVAFLIGLASGGSR